MATNQITGTITTGVTLTSALYDAPVTVTNTANVSGGAYGIYAKTDWTIDNAGTIAAGSGAGHRGVFLADGGAVTNEASGSIGGGQHGVIINGAAGTVDNSGTITGTTDYGVGLGDGGSVTNAATGTISGHRYGVSAEGTSATVENAGTISGGIDSVGLRASGTNRLIVDAGVVFTGNVVANAGAANTLELASSASAGTIFGIGSQYQNFQTVTIDSGASWTVGGTESGLRSETIDGFNSNDRFDVTDLKFSANDAVTLNGSDQLVVDDAGGNLTIQLNASVTGDRFVLADDGHGGTFVEARAIVGPGSTVSGLSASNGGGIIISSGGTAVGDAIGAGGLEIVLSGGTASGSIFHQFSMEMLSPT
jgi:hypothetical protein